MTETNAPETTSRVRPGPHRAYTVALVVFLLDGVLQITLAGLGTFDLPGKKMDDVFNPHIINGDIMAVIALVIVVLAIVAKEGGRVIGLTVLLLVLIAVVQAVLAMAGGDTPFFGALHALDGLVILGLAAYLHSSARRLSHS